MKNMSEQTILVVDDSPYFRAVIKDAALDSGLFLNILEAINGAEALKLFVSNKVTFIITDVEMPIMDGRKLVAAIRATQKGSLIPIIMLTATEQSSTLNCKASDYVVKPFDKDGLIAKIKALVKLCEIRAYNAKALLEGSGTMIGNGVGSHVVNEDGNGK